MKKKVILILIQIFVVAIALALTVTTYAWFVSQTRVTVTETTITAAAGANVHIENEEDFKYEPYKGETGTGYKGDGKDPDGADSPYIVTKNLTVSFSPLGNDAVATAKITSMKITRATGESVNSEDTPEILDCFTCRIVIDGIEYAPDENGFLYREVLEEDAEGGEGEETERVRYEYYYVESDISAEITFKLIFLDETSYAHWLKKEYEDVTPFAYCGYENMRAMFTCGFEVGLSARVETGGADE